MARVVARVLAMDDEAADPCRDRGEVDLRETRSLAEYNVAVACTRAGVAGAVRAGGADDQVVEAIAVDVAGRRHRAAREIDRILAVNDEAAIAGRHGGEVDLGGEARGLAEHHVAVARTVPCISGPLGKHCPDDEVGEAVAVDVAGRGYRPAGLIGRVLAVDNEAAVAGDRGEVDLRRKARGLAEHNVAVPRKVAGVAGPVAPRSPDDEVVEAVAVDVPGRRDRAAGLITSILAVDDETAVPGRDCGKLDLRKPRGLAEHHVAVAGTGAGVAGAVAIICPNQEVIEAVPVDVAGRGHRPPGAVVRILAMDDEAADPGGRIHQIDRHVLRSPKNCARHRRRALRLAAGRPKGLEPCCRRLEFVWRFAGDSRLWYRGAPRPMRRRRTAALRGAFRTRSRAAPTAMSGVGSEGLAKTRGGGALAPPFTARRRSFR